MNDRFAAQVRRHLLETADERPAAGLLAALDAQVATTGQYRPLTARLAGFRGRAIPTRTLRYGLVAAALVGAMLAAAWYVAAPRASTVFEGTWTSIDPGDKSEQSLVVGSGSTPKVRFTDHYATGLACRSDTVKVFTADGHGSIVGNQLSVVWPDGGGCGLDTVEVPEGPYRYQAATDSLVDDQELVWIRADRGLVPPTRGPEPDRTPAPEATIAPSPTPDPSCIQFDAIGTYTAAAGSMSLTVNVPGSAAAPWIGSRDSFRMFRTTCTEPHGTGLTEATQVTRVYTDACAGVSIDVADAAEALAAVSAAKGLVVTGQTQVGIDAYRGYRLDIVVPNGAGACSSQELAVTNDLNPFNLGIGYTLYLFDVEGRILAIALYGSPDWDPTVAGQVNSMIATMEIDLPPTPTIAPAIPAVPASPTPTQA